MNNDKFNWQKGDVQPLTNDTMVCKNCANRISIRNDVCIIFKIVKPTAVLKGGKCTNFKQI